MKMRSLALAALITLAAGSASAVNSVSILWRSTGTGTIGTPAVSASSTITADIVLTADATGVSGFGITVTFDPAELQYVSGEEFTSVNAPGMGNVFNPLAIGVSVNNGTGVILGFDQADLSGVGVVSGTVTMGSFDFHIVSASGMAADIDVTGNTNGGSDGLVDSVGNALPSPGFVGAAVTPEPGAAALGVAALTTLLAIRRRRS